MLLRRVTKHVKDQNWFAVGIDFAIVVIGVVVGLQFSNWNNNRADAASYQEAMQRLVIETDDIYQTSLDETKIIHDNLSDVQAAILVLETCQTDEDAAVVFSRGLNTIRSGSATRPESDALKLLVETESLVRQQDANARSTLRQYNLALDGISEVSLFVVRASTTLEIDQHPSVGFSPIIAPDKSVNGIDVRQARLVEPLEVACKDPSFVKLFYQWERGHNYQLELHRTLRETVRENNEALGLLTTQLETAP